MFSYGFFSGRHFPLPITGACCTVLFVRSVICIVAEHSSAFQHKLNLLQSTSSLVKRVRTNRTDVRIAECVCRAVIRFGTMRIRLLQLILAQEIQNLFKSSDEFSNLVMEHNECAITSQ